MKSTKKMILGALLAGVVALSGVAAPATYAATGRGIDVSVPAYVWPGDPFLEDLKNPVKTPIPPAVVVVNLNNGVGDMSSMDATADALRARTLPNGKHVKVIGYVYTSLGARNINDVKRDVDGWLNVRNGLVHYDGIFFDESARDCGPTAGSMQYRDYYRQLRTYVWNKIPTIDDLVVNNPGTAVADCYLAPSARTADIFVTFEGTVDTYNKIASPATGWVGYSGGNVFSAAGYRVGTEYDSDSFWHLVYGANALSMKPTVQTAFDRYAGHVYVTDDQNTGSWLNPWDQKATYLSSETQFANTIGN